MKVLVADDDRSHVQLVSSRLKGLGFQVISVFDAMQAWITAGRMSPDAVVLDIAMPGGTGFEVLRKLKTNAKTCAIPVIVLSGSIDSRDEQRVKDLGADEYLRKPVDFELLSDALSKLIPKA